MSIISNIIPEMVAATISGVQSTEIEEANLLVLIHAISKLLAEGGTRIPYVISTVPKQRGDRHICV